MIFVARQQSTKQLMVLEGDREMRPAPNPGGYMKSKEK
jgi:hypothetical protein